MDVSFCWLGVRLSIARNSLNFVGSAYTPEKIVQKTINSIQLLLYYIRNELILIYVLRCSTPTKQDVMVMCIYMKMRHRISNIVCVHI